MNTKPIVRIIAGILLAGSFVGLNSCLDTWDFDKLSKEVLITPGVAIPIAYGSLSMSDLLTMVDSSGSVKEYEDSLLYVTYSQDLFSYPATDVVNIPDQDFLELFIEADVSIDAFWINYLMGDTILYSKKNNGLFEFENNERMDSIFVKSMDLEIYVSSTFKHKGIVCIASDSFLIDGEPFDETIQISSDDGSFDTTYTLSLNGGKIYFDNSDPEKTFLPLVFELFLINSKNPIEAGENCNISLRLNNIEFSSLYGYFGSYELLMEEGEIEMPMLGNTDIGGEISFFDPQFILNVSNSYGMPVQIKFDDLTAYSQGDDIITPIVFDGVNPFDILAPSIDSVGTTLKSEIKINNTNCNIVEAIESSPEKFSYSISAVANPLGPDDTDNFITDSSSIDVDFEVVLPMHFKASGFAFEDTIDFDFEDQFGNVVDIIDYFRLELDVKNGLPMEVDIQLYFKDTNYNTLDSLFADEKFLLAPTLNADDRVSEPKEYTKNIEVNSEKLEKIKTTKYFFLRATINTAGENDGDYVKFFSFYDIYFNLKLDAAFNINSSDL